MDLFSIPAGDGMMTLEQDMDADGVHGRLSVRFTGHISKDVARKILGEGYPSILTINGEHPMDWLAAQVIHVRERHPDAIVALAKALGFQCGEGCTGYGCTLCEAEERVREMQRVQAGDPPRG